MSSGYMPNEGIYFLHNTSLLNLIGTIKLELMYGTILDFDHVLSFSDFFPHRAAFAGYQSQDLIFGSPSVISGGGKSVSISNECIFTTTGEDREEFQTVESFYTYHYTGHIVSYGNLNEPMRFKLPGDTLKLKLIHILAEGSI
jgi:hypothetical protein